MLTPLSKPADGLLESWDLAKWNQVLFVHFFVSPHPPTRATHLRARAEARFVHGDEGRCRRRVELCGRLQHVGLDALTSIYF